MRDYADPTAEISLIGACILEPDNLDELSHVEPLALTDSSRRAVWSTLRGMHDRGEPIDPSSVVSAVMREHGNDDAAVSLAFRAPEAVPSRANARHYGDVVVDLAKRRALRSVLATAAGDGGLLRDGTRTVDEAAADVVRRVEAIADGAGPDTWATLGDSAREATERLTSPDAGGPPVSLRALAEAYPRWGESHLVVVAARPGMGKTALMTRPVLDAVAAGRGAMVFSLEMDAAEIATRFVVHESAVMGSSVRTRTLSQREWDAWDATTAWLDSQPIVIDARGALPIGEIRAAARRQARRWRSRGIVPGVICVDYLQLARAEGYHTEAEVLTAVSTGLKALAKELRCCVVALSQLNRDSTKRQNQRPKVAELRGSGSIEQDADVVMFPFRPSEAGDEMASPDEAEIILGKYRHGPTRDVKVRWIGEHMRFEDVGGGNASVSLRGAP